MKGNVFALLLLSLSCAAASPAGSFARSLPSSVSSDRKSYEDTSLVRFLSAPRSAWQGDSLEISFGAIVDRRFKDYMSLHLVPVYISGRDTLRYPELGYFTRSGARYHKRQQALSDTRTAGEVCILRNRRYGDADYRAGMIVPRQGELHLRYILRSCCSEHILRTDTVSVPKHPAILSRPVVNVPLFEANVTFLEPAPEPVKERTASLTIRIEYPQNSWKVYPDFDGNSAELSRIDSVLAPVSMDTVHYTVHSAAIVGYASPEDTYAYNKRLSRLRAGGMRDYLVARYGFPSDSITVSGAGEDWEGLRSSLLASDYREKSLVISIIDLYDVFHGRERAIMDLEGGKVYSELLKDFYPPLRRMELTLNYTVSAFSEEKAGALLPFRPQDLSLREMYKVARANNNDATIRLGRHGYGHEYDIAVRYFPEEACANINASSAALIRGDLELAWFFLSRVVDHPLAANNLGLYYWLRGDTDTAEECFDRAMESDPVRAGYNHFLLQQWKRDNNCFK